MKQQNDLNDPLKGGGECVIMSPIECREQAAQCRRMAEGEPNLRVQAILTDMAKTWDRLAIEARDQPEERTIGAGDVSTALAGEPQAVRPEQSMKAPPK
jgi:hypothetical protein